LQKDETIGREAACANGSWAVGYCPP